MVQAFFSRVLALKAIHGSRLLPHSRSAFKHYMIKALHAFFSIRFALEALHVVDEFAVEPSFVGVLHSQCPLREHLLYPAH